MGTNTCWIPRRGVATFLEQQKAEDSPLAHVIRRRYHSEKRRSGKQKDFCSYKVNSEQRCHKRKFPLFLPSRFNWSWMLRISLRISIFISLNASLVRIIEHWTFSSLRLVDNVRLEVLSCIDPFPLTTYC